MYGIYCEIIHNIKYMFSQNPHEMKEIRILDLSRNYNIKSELGEIFIYLFIYLFIHSFTYEFITDRTPYHTASDIWEVNEMAWVWKEAALSYSEKLPESLLEKLRKTTEATSHCSPCSDIRNVRLPNINIKVIACAKFSGGGNM